MIKIYIYNGIEYEEMPYWLWPNTSPITETFFIEQGGRIEEREVPPAPEEILHFSKLQILLHMRADLPNYGDMSGINGDALFISVLKQLDFYNAWNAADYISTDYDNFEEIKTNIHDAMMQTQLNWYIQKWQDAGYSQKEIDDKSEGFKRGFNVMWTKMEENVKKYGEA